MHHFGLVVALFAFDDVFGGDAAFGEVDVTLEVVLVRVSCESVLFCSDEGRTQQITALLYQSK